MKTKNTRLLYSTISFLGFAGLAFTSSAAAQSGIHRTELQRHDLSTPGREAVQVIVALDPGTVAAKHSHPGEEIIYVTEGVIEYEVEGKPPVTLKAGEVLFIPAGTVHGARNNGTVRAAELATYIVDKNKPIAVIKK